MQGNYLILQQGKVEVPFILPPGLEHMGALKLFKLNLNDVASAGTFNYDPHFRLGGFAFRCECVNIGQRGGGNLFSRSSQDAAKLRDTFERNT